MLGFITWRACRPDNHDVQSQMVERRRWLSKERFVESWRLHIASGGPEALQLAIYVGYLKRGVWPASPLAYLHPPGAVVMVILSLAVLEYGSLHG